MNINDAAQFIESEVPPTIRRLFPKTLSGAYKAVDDLIRETPFLQVETVQRGDLIAWAADFAFYKLATSGQWPVDGAEWSSFVKPTGKYLKIRTKNAMLTVSQLVDMNQTPRHAVFRENARFYNQPFLFPDMEPGSSDVPHLIIGHGYHALSFITVGMPHPEKPCAWLENTKNVLDEIGALPNDLAPIEAADVEAVPEIKELIRKRQADDAN